MASEQQPKRARTGLPIDIDPSSFDPFDVDKVTKDKLEETIDGAQYVQTIMGKVMQEIGGWDGQLPDEDRGAMLIIAMYLHEQTHWERMSS
jgi:flagellar biosynthesis regulator FlaF